MAQIKPRWEEIKRNENHFNNGSMCFRILKNKKSFGLKFWRSLSPKKPKNKQKQQNNTIQNVALDGTKEKAVI